jgi:molybdopterin-guanine dinucleotide biosynthesis protein A
VTAAADQGTGAPSNGQGGTLLVFLNEVAGGRKLLEAVRERVEEGVSDVAVVAPQNQPMAGQIVDRDEVREAAQSRVEVTQAILKEFGIDSVGAVMDPDPALALDDAIRAFEPREVLLSCLYDTRFGFTRKDLVEWAKQRFELPITHIPVRIEDDAVRWDVTHTLVVATRTVASNDLLSRLKAKAKEHPNRYTIVSPPSGDLSREEVCARLARALAELYRSDIDATGQPMSPAPLAAVENALEHYRIDEILVSTLAGEQSKWLEQGLLDDIRAMTDQPVEHVESGGDVAERSVPEPEGAPVAVGAGRDEEGSVTTGGGTGGGRAAGGERSG